ncbi:putative oxidoreductase YcjS [Anaerohalosphaera lusitana]|uniref:Putative oxidoreductase YcjS n=1 Tax=Anaerohalosphaera lusitana TaxID=1936003 RepID=A0A1U9NLV3_9BACT|nr:Gfo/Idh/MocA family oxidoreductase [Anaerohalosphaera lusitana]AQT68913.1 putative oxidoreductase YcjS [Anaerohalosphaera lusitana]
MAKQGRINGKEKIRIGVVGCGGRGWYDSDRSLKSDPNVEIYAMADLFQDKLDHTLKGLKNQYGDRINVAKNRQFVGFDAYKQLLECDLDLVILTTPPSFRPEHLRAAVEAGKHVFMEKPVAVDPVGVRSVIESSELADKKGLTIMAGTQARQMSHRVELMKRIHDGQIGDIVTGQCFRVGGAMRGWGVEERKADWSDMEWQIRRWLFNTWLSGDFICEMHIHELDIVNWAMGGPPVKCMAMGGREARTDELYGNIFDHFSVEYEYENGVRIFYAGSQIDGATVRTNERIVGTKGIAYTDWARSYIEGENPFKYDGPNPDPCISQHNLQFQAMRNGEKLNQGVRVAHSTLTAIMGRMSAYTGKELSWKWVLNASKLDLSPDKYEFGDMPKPEIAVPGETPLV